MKSPLKIKYFVVGVKQCSQCGLDHEEVKIYPFHGNVHYTHWGICPAFYEPIFFNIIVPNIE